MLAKISLGQYSNNSTPWTTGGRRNPPASIISFAFKSKSLGLEESDGDTGTPRSQ